MYFIINNMKSFRSYAAY